ncbi:MAG: ATP-binding protein, partial [Nitrospiraceae bacterium]
PATKAKSYESWGKDFAAWLSRTQKLELLKSPSLKEVSRPGESERDFRIRLQQATHEQRDQAVERLRQKYAPKMTALQERIRRAEQAVEREAEQARQSQIQTVISVGATLLGALMGRKTISASTLGRATTAARGAGRVFKEAKDVSQARETVEALQQQLRDLEAQLNSETELLTAATDPQTERLETIILKPTKTNISTQLVALTWVPYWLDAQGKAIPAYA